MYTGSKSLLRVAATVLAPLLYMPTAQGQLSLEPNTDRPGKDYQNPLSHFFWDAETCRNGCLADSKCRAYTWVPVGDGKEGRCWLKDSVPSPVSSTGMISGVKRTIKARPPMTDHETRRYGMHTCPMGLFMTGIHRGNDLLLCEWFGGTPGEIIDSGTQPYGYRRCPDGYAMTGLHIGKNQLACAQHAVSRAGYTLGGVNPMQTRFGLGACAEGYIMIGYIADDDVIMCAAAAVALEHE